MSSFQRFCLIFSIVSILAIWAWTHYDEGGVPAENVPQEVTYSPRSEGTIPSIDIVELENRVHFRANRKRAGRDLDELGSNKGLVRLARAHSHDMATHNFFAHTNQRGFSPEQRAEQADFHCPRNPTIRRQLKGVGENIYMGTLYYSYKVTYEGDQETRTYDWKTIDEFAAEIVNGWMKSEGHRMNILNKAYHLQGIGIAVDGNHQVFVTQNFC